MGDTTEAKAEPKAAVETAEQGHSNGPLVDQQTSLTTSSGFALAQRVARALSESSLVPEQYRQNIPNCLVALEIAHRIGASPLFVCQNLYVISGRPSWSSTFIIASINSCGRFSPLRFTLKGSGMERTCVASAIEKATGEILEGPAVSMAMAKAEGWLGKNGSKWQTMPELMLRYRSAAFFGRLYAPEMLLGMQAAEEVQDVIDVMPTRVSDKPIGVAGAKSLFAGEEPQAPATEAATGSTESA